MHRFRITTLALAAFTSPSAAQTRESALAAKLGSPVAGERRAAVLAAAQIDPAQTRQELRQALIAALRREASAHAARTVRYSRGGTPPEIEDPELMALMAGAVIRLHDRNAIGVLAEAMVIGSAIPRELARWGDAGVLATMAAMQRPGAPSAMVHDGLMALRMAIEVQRVDRLSPATLAKVRAVAAANLAAEAGLDEYGVTLRWTIDLAISSGDAGLRQIVTQIAESAQEVSGRGVRGKEWIAKVQRHAADRLRGVPPLPRP